LSGIPYPFRAKETTETKARGDTTPIQPIPQTHHKAKRAPRTEPPKIAARLASIGRNAVLTRAPAGALLLKNVDVGKPVLEVLVELLDPLEVELPLVAVLEVPVVELDEALVVLEVPVVVLDEALVVVVAVAEGVWECVTV